MRDASSHISCPISLCDEPFAPQGPLGRRADEVDADAGQPHVGAVPDGETHLDANPGGVVSVVVLACFFAALSTREIWILETSGRYMYYFTLLIVTFI